MTIKVFIMVIAALLSLILGIGLGNVNIPPADILSILANRLLGAELPEHIRPGAAAILMNRFPRVLLAMLAGASLSVSGVVMQSVMRNPLASSFTMGVSSGASLGAALVIFYGAGLGLGFAANFALPVMGFAFGLGTIFLAIALARKLDRQARNNTIILIGIVISLFINAVTTLMSSFSRELIEQLTLWQMGSFSGARWPSVQILTPVVILGVLFIFRMSKELDILTFGENQAATMGLNVPAAKRALLVAAAALTGGAIAFSGVIGFIDLVSPHIVRKIFGAGHRIVVPMSALFGGAFMVLCDVLARTALPVGEIPVGAVTALIGAPFFAWIYFGGRKKDAAA